MKRTCHRLGTLHRLSHTLSDWLLRPRDGTAKTVDLIGVDEIAAKSRASAPTPAIPVEVAKDWRNSPVAPLEN
jgi:hypothetical protein